MNYAIFRKFLSIRDCNELLAIIENIRSLPIDLGLVDGDYTECRCSPDQEHECGQSI